MKDNLVAQNSLMGAFQKRVEADHRVGHTIPHPMQGAWRSSRFSRSRAFILSAIWVGMPARRPLSTSALLPHAFRVCGVQPILAAIDTTACQRGGG